ncbi:dTDP-glucose 4,6-dehydratase [Campylobacter sputorum subsp. bubulus]|uniref:dTDP-glucose 4,6-dehydratase n=1 Tax=Campylobacter sputorum subsp. sputorum TaxID=32024 RepID=A0A381DJ67_9BACT|nr:NAD-dependent 4,6-dehydratase LegB [Campylobacter sputorum]ASM35756.1 NAD-dependent epimerase/dehydratase [Campylobacter sputorum aubsp. sputorum RM3237]KAB0581460.1 SDR family NAD(P)-dependent oxidoreductase [Campylobacter sputorum subsp. sputorum]QEL05946.1 NAD-dependent epimerase/dehydratase [Campylobacter sputorum subsp. sputorum]SUX09043.1 dTDP-glucose 4,6-dehydratase [Campylobacter sputorum subsp. bubulus]SUX10733.1 dTDP-glucose 4,6-dehydratase [Campylobacter sputorum subsp. sputorum]
MKNVLVTGADGFIGSHLCEMLVERGYNVKALSQYNSFNFWGWLEDCKNLREMEVVSGDLRDSFFCETLLQNIDTIFHLGALIAIPYSYQASQSYVDTNIQGTLNMLQAAKKSSNLEKFIHTSTSEVYGTAQYVPIDENHPLQPQSPYSASKIAADMLALSFYNSFDLPVSVARPFNTYGPRQSARAVIPNIIIQILNNKKVIKMGDLTPTRDFNFVLDTCEGFLEIAKCENSIGEVINIGSNSEISIKDTFEMIKKLTSSNIEILEDKKRIRPKKSEVFRLKCDNSKIKRLSNFQPKFSLEKGLKITIDWFSDKKNLKKYKSEIYNV